MANKTVNIITVICLLVSANSRADDAEKDYALRIYLPREVTINGDIPNLGQVGIIRGQESLVVKAGEIALGRISLPGQEIIVDRQAVLSRLACNGIAASEVMLTGAEKVLVKRQHQNLRFFQRQIFCLKYQLQYLRDLKFFFFYIYQLELIYLFQC